MAHNIERFEEYYCFIKTKKIRFQKGTWVEWISIDNKIKVIAETEKAILIREKNQSDKEDYSVNPFWIPKSRIITKKEAK